MTKAPYYMTVAWGDRARKRVRPSAVRYRRDRSRRRSPALSPPPRRPSVTSQLSAVPSRRSALLRGDVLSYCLDWIMGFGFLAGIVDLALRRGGVRVTRGARSEAESGSPRCVEPCRTSFFVRWFQGVREGEVGRFSSRSSPRFATQLCGLTDSSNRAISFLFFFHCLDSRLRSFSFSSAPCAIVSFSSSFTPCAIVPSSLPASESPSIRHDSESRTLGQGEINYLSVAAWVGM